MKSNNKNSYLKRFAAKLIDIFLVFIIPNLIMFIWIYSFTADYRAYEKEVKLEKIAEAVDKSLGKEYTPKVIPVPKISQSDRDTIKFLDENSTLLTIAFFIFVNIAFILYEATLLSRYGTTVGKYCWGIKVLDKNGEKLSFLSSCERSLAFLNYGVFYFVPIIIIFTVFKSIKNCFKALPMQWEDNDKHSVILDKITIYDKIVMTINGIFSFLGLAILASTTTDIEMKIKIPLYLILTGIAFFIAAKVLNRFSTRTINYFCNLSKKTRIILTSLLVWVIYVLSRQGDYEFLGIYFKSWDKDFFLVNLLLPPIIIFLSYLGYKWLVKR